MWSLLAACSGPPTADGTRLPPPLPTDTPGSTAETGSPASTGDTAPTEPPPEPVTWANPVLDQDFPDPFVLPVEGGYLAFATNTWWANVPVAVSQDLAHWSTTGDALPTLPAWARSGAFLTWAPGVMDRGDGTWVLYFTARDEASDRQCIGVATATDPAGPYAADAAPIVCQASLGGSIDPFPFVDSVESGGDGSRWLLWKNDGNCCKLAVGLWSQPLAADGRTLTGSPTQLLALDQPWEEPLIENPAMARIEGHLHLLYSANWWESAAYAVGAAICDTPAGPCTKVGPGGVGTGPVFASADPVLGPGGEAFFRDHDGRDWLAYHAWTAPDTTYAAGGARSLRIDPVQVTAGVLAIAGPSVGPQTVP